MLTTVKEVQAFLGFANFYRRFIKNYSKVAQPLTELTKKFVVETDASEFADKAILKQTNQSTTFKWTTGAEVAFKELKERFTNAPILATFNPSKKIILETDSSDFAIGACLS